jgi:hypothetical protein
VSMSVVRHHISKYKKTMPRAYETVFNSNHVDDTADSFETVEEAIEVTKQLKEAHAEMTMEFKKISSNKQEVLQAFPQDYWAKGYEFLENLLEMKMPTKKCLGVSWDSKNDILTFSPREEIGKVERITKRVILREYSLIFDPIGILAPALIEARITMQSCWKVKVDWDEEAPEEIQKRWNKWVESLKHLPEIKVPRVLIPTFSDKGNQE